MVMYHTVNRVDKIPTRGSRLLRSATSVMLGGGVSLLVACVDRSRGPVGVAW